MKSGPALTSEVVADHHHVHQIADLSEETGVEIGPEVEGLIQRRLTESGILDGVHEPSLQPPHVPADFVHHASDIGAESVRRGLTHTERMFPHSGEAGGIAAVGIGVTFHILDGGVPRGDDG